MIQQYHIHIDLLDLISEQGKMFVMAAEIKLYIADIQIIMQVSDMALFHLNIFGLQRLILSVIHFKVI